MRFERSSKICKTQNLLPEPANPAAYSKIPFSELTTGSRFEIKPTFGRST
ncbi:MAG TPA: hypothetical protein PKJ75_05850 [Methanosarcina vacuolata]|nr:hypothetical protein [Methanosarcina vacuolata]